MYAKERQSLGAFSFPNQLTKGLTRGKMVNALCPVLIFLIHLFLSTPILFFLLGFLSKTIHLLGTGSKPSDIFVSWQIKHILFSIEIYMNSSYQIFQKTWSILIKE